MSVTEGQNMHAIWNVHSGNLLGQYASEIEALDAVGGLLIANGIDYAGELVLARDDADGLPESIDAGLSLARRAFAASDLTGSYHSVVSVPVYAGIAETTRWEWSTRVTLDVPMALDFHDLISGAHLHTGWFTTAPARSQADEATKQPALALAA